MPMVLKPLDGGRPIPLDKAIVFFGRGPDCDVVLNTSRKVSRKHCCVAQINDYFLVRDLGSMNGIRVNEDPVSSEARLKVGDILWVGDLGFRFQPLTTNGASPGSPRKARPPVVDPKFLSQEIPVAIPDEEVDFSVENTGGIRAPLDSEPMVDASENGEED
ncbi:MAG: FHA domain-containing protein [Planctomycetaceae bacterium]|nr:FHA domain-containing protein [Planctomycetaceae bacterium]